jgi:hypothetical protein
MPDYFGPPDWLVRFATPADNGQSSLKQQTVSAWVNAAVFMVLAAHWSPGLAERPRGMRNAGVIANSNGIRQ